MKIYDVVIIGSGFSGITCAHYLKEEGIDSFCILEKNNSLGGVWAHGGVGPMTINTLILQTVEACEASL